VWASAAQDGAGLVAARTASTRAPTPKSAEAMAKAAAKSVGAAKSVPIEPGQLDITANVIVVFELK
jgi:uncharacterized protein YggE